MKKMRCVAAVGLLAGLIAVAAGMGGRPGVLAAEKDSKPGDKIGALLQATGLLFKRMPSPKENTFRVMIEGKGEVTPVIVEEKKAPWKSKAGEDVLYAYFYTEVLALPKEFKPPPAMLMRMADMNNNFQFGNIGLEKRPDGGQSIFHNMSCFLRGIDAEQLSDYLEMMHNDRVSLRKELRGYLEEAK